jgi:transposase-like protein
MHDAIRQNSTLSPAQAQVIAALAAGESITGAARAAGVHRSTIHNWLREGQQFRFEFDTIRQETVEFLRNRLAGLEVAALAALKSLIVNRGCQHARQHSPEGCPPVLKRPQFHRQPLRAAKVLPMC